MLIETFQERHNTLYGDHLSPRHYSEHNIYVTARRIFKEPRKTRNIN